MHRDYDWLPKGEFPNRPDAAVALGLFQLARSTKSEDHEDLMEIALLKGKAEVRFALDAASLQREAVRAQEFRVLQWLIAAIAFITFVATAVQAYAALRGHQ